MGEGCWRWHTVTAGFSKTGKERVQLIRVGVLDCSWWAGVLFEVGNYCDPLPHDAVVIVTMLYNLHYVLCVGSSNPSSQIHSTSPVGLAVT